MALKIPNPMVWLGSMLGSALTSAIESNVPPDPGAPAPVPATVPATVPAAPGDDQATDIVTGRFVPDGQESTSQVSANVHTEEFRQLIASFDEDKQGALEWIVRKFFTILAYILPPFVAYVVGMAIGDAFSGKFDVTNSWSLYAHVISVSLEMMLPVMGYAVTVTFKRVLKDRSQAGIFIALGLVFLLVSIGNSFAQIFLIEKNIHISDSDLPGHVSMYFRSFGPLVIDVIATIYLSVASVKSLQKYLADQRAKIVAVKDVNQVNIEMDEQTIKAAIDRQSAIMDMESKRKRSDTWNQIEAMQAQAMIDNARRNMLDSGSGSGYKRSSW